MAITLKDLCGLAVIFVTIAIILSVGSDVITNVGTSVEISPQ